MTVTAESLEWQDLAACHTSSLDLLFGSDGETAESRKRRETQAIQQLCAQCPVRTDCLGYAIDSNVKDGVWGGMGEDERAAYRTTVMRRARQARARQNKSAA
jgi:WhiB family transcriptional regulator, redox-sensing transcriptional regulator